MSNSSAARTAAIDRLLKDAADAGDVPGVVAMATDRDGAIYEGAFGQRVLGEPAPMRLDSVAWIASMTKAITGTAAMQLVEQGKLDLDAAGQPKTRPPKRPITLRHLMTHTAGFGYEIWNSDIASYQAAKNVPGII